MPRMEKDNCIISTLFLIMCALLAVSACLAEGEPSAQIGLVIASTIMGIVAIRVS